MLARLRTANYGETGSIGWILLTAAVIRFTAVLVFRHRHSASYIFGQGQEMFFVARSIAEGHGIAQLFGDSTGPTAVLAPIFPGLIALIMRAVGSERTPDILLVIHCLVSVATVWVVHRLASLALGIRVANLAAFACALMPNMSLMVILFWDSCISSFLLAVLCYLAVVAFNQEPTHTETWIAFSLIAGFAILFNPSLLFVAGALVIWASKRERSLLKIGIAAAIVSCVLLPWEIRCWRVTGHVIPLRDGLPLELWMGNRPGSDGELQGSIHPVGSPLERQLYNHLGEMGYMKLKMKQFTTFVSQRPSSFVRLTLLRFSLFWGFRRSAVSPILLCSFVGIWLLRKHRYAAVWILPALLWPVPYYLTHADERFTAILEPLLYIPAAYAIAALLGNQSSRADAKFEQ